MSPAEGARARVPSFEPAQLDDPERPVSRPTARRAATRTAPPSAAGPGSATRSGSATAPAPGRGRPGATRWADPAPEQPRSEQPRTAEHPPSPDRLHTDRPHTDGRDIDRRPDDAAVRSGIRLNGLWCAVLLVVGVAVALALAGALSWQPGVPTTIALAAVGIGVALLAGRGGGFEAGVLPGTVVIVVGAILVASDPGALGGAVAGLGPVSRVWQAIGLLAPAAAATWACALVTLALRRTGLLRRF